MTDTMEGAGPNSTPDNPGELELSIEAAACYADAVAGLIVACVEDRPVDPSVAMVLSALEEHLGITRDGRVYLAAELVLNLDQPHANLHTRRPFSEHILDELQARKDLRAKGVERGMDPRSAVDVVWERAQTAAVAQKQTPPA